MAFCEGGHSGEIVHGVFLAETTEVQSHTRCRGSRVGIEHSIGALEKIIGEVQHLCRFVIHANPSTAGGVIDP
jgi:hypothetical protein